jgi:hypothetical protein
MKEYEKELEDSKEISADLKSFFKLYALGLSENDYIE